VQEFVYTSADVSVDQLEFDPENPRLPRDIDASSVDAMLRFMLDDAGLVDLTSSIAAQGFFPGEPLLCCPDPKLERGATPPTPTTDSRYVVVEGNRRLAAVTLLRNPEAAPSRKQAIRDLAATNGAPDHLPTIIFPRRDDILDYLGYRHITGIKEWEPLAKARYLQQVRDRKLAAGDPSEPRDLARLIGSNGPYVARLLTALGAWDRLGTLGFFAEHDLTAEDLPFAVFSTALNYERIPPWLHVDPMDDRSVDDVDEDNLSRLARWFFVADERVPKNRPLLRESRNIRYINEIVGDEEAMASLEEANTPQLAASLTAGAAQVFSEAVNESGKYMTVAVRRFDGVERPGEHDEERLTTIRDQAEKLRVGVAERLTAH
jgi:hypothetical protein